MPGFAREFYYPWFFTLMLLIRIKIHSLHVKYSREPFFTCSRVEKKKREEEKKKKKKRDRIVCISQPYKEKKESINSMNLYPRPKWLSYSCSAHWRTLVDTSLQVPRTKVKKIDKVNKSLPLPKMLGIFVLSVLTYPSRHVFASPWAKTAKNQ
ncbi:hypothetical protein Y032_0466g1976 [Ancylostoma ceylanicum]|uniref:Uncharacterized protein n=1 Tax=Ancylostoma ceylanicum TaxID=53326 RepID=A0A016WZ32_9BILA|nr:hypothetical protein Y032_0466g1976 [Ancylostoma ceylanicum]